MVKNPCHGGAELVDDITSDIKCWFYDKIEDGVLDGHTYPIPNDLSDGLFGRCNYFQIDVGREEKMLSSG
jgi:hypothetical protein